MPFSGASYRRLAALAVAACLAGCDGAAPSAGGDAASANPAASSWASVPAQALAPPAATTEPQHQGLQELILLAGGDVSFGRMRGQRLLREPERNDFETLASLLSTADIRFVNLESTLSDQGGETISPISKLIFTGPPAGARVLARAGIDIVSLANNHAWDYGPAALLETMDHLEGAGVRYVGAARAREQAYAPQVIERAGLAVAFVAVTDIWNQGPLGRHPGQQYVAEAREPTLVESIHRARARADVVVVSYHGGYEYVDTPHEATRRLLRAAVGAGADVVIGHHPHVVQRVEIVGGKPIFYSLGNLLMRMATGRPWTEFGLLARLRLRRAAPPAAELCPFRIYGLEPIALARDPQRAGYESIFRFKFEQLLRAGALVDPPSAVSLGPFGDDGCAPLEPRSSAVAAPGPSGAR